MNAAARIIASAILLALAACGDEPPHLQGYVEGDFLLIGAEEGGQVASLAVTEGSEVARGESLFALDDTAAEADVKSAESALKAAEARLADARSGARQEEIDTLLARREQAQASRALSQIQFTRQERLVESGTRPPEALDEARAALERDEAALEEINQEIAVARLGSRINQIEAAAEEAQAARAALEKARWQFDERRVEAPKAGRISEILARPGEVVDAGQPVVMLLPPDNLKIRFYMPQAMMAQITQGAIVDVSCDGCPEIVPARVSFVAREVEFTPPVIFSQESRDKLVVMAEARPTEPVDFLRPGQPVTVRVQSASADASSEETAADARTGD